MLHRGRYRPRRFPLSLSSSYRGMSDDDHTAVVNRSAVGLERQTIALLAKSEPRVSRGLTSFAKRDQAVRRATIAIHLVCTEMDFTSNITMQCVVVRPGIFQRPAPIAW